MGRDRDWAGMAVGDEVRDVLTAVDDVEPSPDLWSRLAQAIRDDVARRRRRRILVVVLGAVALSLVLVAVEGGVLGGVVVDWRAMEVAETVIMLAVVVGLRPLLHDAGRGFVAEAFAGNEGAAERFTGLVDLAWTLLFTGWVLATTEWRPTVAVTHHIGHQLGQFSTRLAGLLLGMGLLHGLTLLVLPVVGLFWTAARTRRSVPRWVAVLVVIGLVPVVLVGVNVAVGILVAGASGG